MGLTNSVSLEANLAAPGTAPIQIALDSSAASADTDELLTAILRSYPRASDVIFSPGRGPQVQSEGKFLAVEIPGSACLTADDTRRIASELIGSNKAAIAMLREQGYCDLSYGVAGVARFRVNVFIQRSSCAVVMRVIPTDIPELKALGTPEQLRDMVSLCSGLVLVTGPRGSGKSSTLAALINHINETEECHIITVEDPIEFLHIHKRATVHQRELHSDTPSISQALRAALRQASNVIVVGELKDHEEMELALEAAETGHLVLSTFNTLTAPQAVERFVSAFPAAEQANVRERLERMLRYVICQRLIRRQQDSKRVAVYEIVRCHLHLPTQASEQEQNALGAGECSRLDGELEALVRQGQISREAALEQALEPAKLLRKLSLCENPLTRD
ncbi:MAG: PilT/PilU family type 4a pilus ATPase [Acidobacteria bacterium]|nr:PilT/PilU family type 4a pilus ATPase [Acidobacteriota bacterium]